MARLDLYHRECRRALEKDDWEITDDPYHLDIEQAEMSVDLGAEKIIAATKGKEKIAVEIKTFGEKSLTYAFHNAHGQYANYEMILEDIEPDRILFLAVTEDVFEKVFTKSLGRIALEKKRIKLLVFNPQTETITKWIK
jgi:hypothetical protein